MFVAGAYSVISKGLSFADNLSVLYLLFLAIALSYATASQFLNRTRFSLNTEQFTIKHGPLPWLGEKRIATLAIKQLYVKEVASRK